jgi:hypothetical protein
MILYRWKKRTMEYIGSQEARLDPLEEKLGNTVYLIPARSTEVAPPSLGENETAYWNGTSWDVFDTTPVESVLPDRRFVIAFTEEELDQLKATTTSDDFVALLRTVIENNEY